MAQITINEFAKRAYAFYINAGLTPAGACGLMGNEYSESAGFLSNRVEFLCIQRLKEHGKTYTNESYTSAVDTGKISRAEFLNPLPNKQYGYGLVQWTTPARKAGLYDRTVAVGKSIADQTAQLEYSLYELQTKYPSVLSTLKTTTSVKTASDKVLKDFECPNNWQSLSATRADYGQQYYSYFVTQGNGSVSKGGNTVTKTDAINAVINTATNELGYLEKASNAYLDDKTKNAGSANYTKYWRDVYPAYQGQAWCACFVSWVFMKTFGLEVAKKLLKHWPYVYCPTLGTLFTKNANPKVGDIVIFYRNGVFAHTGLVTAVNGDQFTTIEGNTSGASGVIPNGGGVCKKSYYNSQLPGTKFCTPDYSLVSSVQQTSSGSTLNETVKWTGVITEKADIKTWAGNTEKNVSFSPLNAGAEVGVCDTIKSKTGNDWYFIKYNGKFGFVYSGYVNKKEEVKTVKYCYITKKSSPVRTGAGVAKKQCSFSPLIKGTKLEIIKTVKNSLGKIWYQVKWNGKTGYIYSKNVSLTPVDGEPTIAKKAVANARAIAQDNNHGYNNTKGYRGGPDFACSSFVAECYIKSGVKLGTTSDKVYTKDMKKIFTSHGFIDVTSKVNTKTCKGMLEGDVLINPGVHTEIYTGNKMMIGARGNPNSGKPEGGKVGDQTGNEITESKYVNNPWKIVLRYKEKVADNATPSKQVQYRVQTGIYGLQDNAVNMKSKMMQKGFDCLIVKSNGQYITQAGLFLAKMNADALAKKIKAAGLPVAVVEV